MTDRGPGNSDVCRRFAEFLYEFQAGELSPDERRPMADHVEACPPCARRLAVENGLLRAVKQRLARAPAPPELRARIRQALAAEPAAHGGRLAAWLRAPWLVPAAAALVLAALLLPAMPQLASVITVERDVTVVDLDCERAGRSLEEQQLCTHPWHLNALRVAPGDYWSLSLDLDSGRRIAIDRGMRGHRLRVTGDLYARIRTLHLKEYVDRDAVPPTVGLRGPTAGAVPARALLPGH